MDVQTIMDQILQSGKELAEKGKTLAEDQLGVPKQDGEQREAMMSGLGKGAAVTGVLALLLGTRLGRRLSGKALKYGSLAALGTIAFKAYQNYQTDHGEVAAAGESVGDLSGEAAQKRSSTLLKAMISAAKADGHIDDAERKAIQTQLEQLNLSEESMYLIHAELEKGIDVAALASEVDTPSAAAEVYLASRMVLDVNDMSERAYLDQLASALNLSDELVDKLENEV